LNNYTTYYMHEQNVTANSLHHSKHKLSIFFIIIFFENIRFSKFNIQLAPLWRWA